VTGIAAQRIWYAVSPNGDGDKLVLRVSVPVDDPDKGWGCTVYLGILEAHSYTIYGVDAWQAIREAMLFVARRIGHYAEDGWLFYWEKDGEPADASEIAYDPNAF
jgi:hypothetical protein